jgi:hypothetical protein
MTINLKQATMNFTTIGEAKRQTGLSYLGGVNVSAKMIKNMKVSNNMTYAIYLAPAMVSGYNVCPNSTPECRLGCLATSGRAGMDILSGKGMVERARIKKTKLFHEENDFFMDWLFKELTLAKAKANRKGFDFSVRLNATSDIDWQNVKRNGKNVFEMFPDVNFYDYTKNPTKFIDKAENYHLTFSYSGHNVAMCEKLLNKGFNVATVFNVKSEKHLPKTFMGYNVINGDLTDFRPNDGKGIIVGLKWKQIANVANNKAIKESIFVVQPESEKCGY